MKAFLVGLLVLLLMAISSVVMILLIPFVMVLGFFLRWIMAVVLVIFTVWLIGKITLVSIDYFRKKEESPVP